MRAGLPAADVCSRRISRHGVARWSAWAAVVLLLTAYAASHRDYGVGYSRRYVQVALPGSQRQPEVTLSLEELAPLAAAPQRPAVVLLHGYLASPAMLERLYAEELVRRGFLAVIPRGFMDAGVACADCRTLQARTAPILAVLDHLRNDPRVDGNRIGILGHSYGSSLAMETACADWGVVATVAMAGSLQSFDYVNHACPRNLLLLHGDDDRFTSDRHQSFILAKATRGMAQSEDRLWGDVRQGDGRLLKIIAGAGHVTVLAATEARQLAVDWLESSLAPGRRTSPVQPLPLAWLLLGLAATLVLVEAVGAMILGRSVASPAGPVPFARIVLATAGLLSVSWVAKAAIPYVYGRLQPALELPQIGGEVLASTLVLCAMAVLPLWISGAWWSAGARRRGGSWWRPPLACGARIVLLYCCLRLLLQGYYDPTPGAAHLTAAAASLPLLFAALLPVSAAASTLDRCFAGVPVARVLRLPRLALAAALLAALWPLADRYNDVVAPAIHLVPFHLAGAVALLCILCGPAGEPASSRALFAATFALWLLALVFPLGPRLA